MRDEDIYWFTPCPEGFEIGPWREACEEIVRLCGDPVIPLHNEDVNRTIAKALEAIRARPSTQET